MSALLGRGAAAGPLPARGRPEGVGGDLVTIVGVTKINCFYHLVEHNANPVGGLALINGQAWLWQKEESWYQIWHDECEDIMSYVWLPPHAELFWRYRKDTGVCMEGELRGMVGLVACIKSFMDVAGMLSETLTDPEGCNPFAVGLIGHEPKGCNPVVGALPATSRGAATSPPGKQGGPPRRRTRTRVPSTASRNP